MLRRYGTATFRWVRSQTKILTAIIATALVTSGTAAVFASIPDGSGVIHACYSNASGAVNIIDSSTQTCTNK